MRHRRSEVGENINTPRLILLSLEARLASFTSRGSWTCLPGMGLRCSTRIPKSIGEYSGPDHGHSLSLHERTYLISYMAGADVMIAEGGWLNFFKSQTLDENGTLPSLDWEKWERSSFSSRITILIAAFLTLRSH